MASVSWCAAVRLPIVVAYVAGVGKAKKHGLILSAFFALGLMAGIVLLGATAGAASDGVHRVLHADKVLFWGLGLALFISGVLVSGLIDPQVLPQRLKSIGVCLSKAGLPGAFLLGGAFGLLQTAACPHCGPALLALVETAAVEGSPSRGLRLASFAAGQGLLVLGVGVLASLARSDLLVLLRARMCSIEQRARLLAGNLLMVLGIYFVIVG
jgi:hypothetical protein